MTSAQDCECSEEYGPCEDHSVVLAQRGGAAECVWCGRVDRCSDAGTGQATCEDCWHRMDWHRSCEIGDPDTICPMCSKVLASHVHAEYTTDEDNGR